MITKKKMNTTKVRKGFEALDCFRTVKTSPWPAKSSFSLYSHDSLWVPINVWVPVSGHHTTGRQLSYHYGIFTSAGGPFFFKNEAQAMLGPAVCMALIPLVKCDSFTAIALLTVAMAFLGLSGGGHVSIVPDVAPVHAASIFGLVNSIGCIAGIFSPLVAGFLLENASSKLDLLLHDLFT
ncbi:UNVERIFIED_CONTAM: hypothetical protein NCL1_25285 [Trichonephila clavipes]